MTSLRPDAPLFVPGDSSSISVVANTATEKLAQPQQQKMSHSEQTNDNRRGKRIHQQRRFRNTGDYNVGRENQHGFHRVEQNFQENNFNRTPLPHEQKKETVKRSKRRKEKMGNASRYCNIGCQNINSQTLAHENTKEINQRRRRRNKERHKKSSKQQQNQTNHTTTDSSKQPCENTDVLKVEDELTFPTLVPLSNDKKQKITKIDNSSWVNGKAKTILQDNMTGVSEPSERSISHFQSRKTSSKNSLNDLTLTVLRKNTCNKISKNDETANRKSREEETRHQNQEQENTLDTKRSIDAGISEDSFQTSSMRASVAPGNSSDSTRMKTRDISKLRDRWWDLLQKHYEERQEADRNQEAGNSNDDGDSDNDDYNDWFRTRISDEQDTEAESSESDGENFLNYYYDEISNAYASSEYPLHDAIRKNDETAVDHLIISEMNRTNSLNFINSEISAGGEKGEHGMSPLQLAVALNRPNILRILLEACKRLNHDWNNMNAEQSRFPAPLLIAAEHGYEECIEIMLNSFTSPASSILMVKDSDGNTALHYCFRRTAPLSTLQLLFHYAASAKGYVALVTKILSSRNYSKQQTPLHIACHFGRSDLVDYVLNKLCGISTLSKLLAIQDADEQTPLLTAVASGSSDIVMSLLMWRGNNSLYRNRSKTYSSAAGSISGVTSYAATGSSHPCPLLWAVTKSNNVDMVLLLLEFNNPSSNSGYDLNGALRAAVLSRSEWHKSSCKKTVDSRESLEIIRILVEAGANPCAVPDSDNFSSSKRISQCSTVTLAIKNHDFECLTLMIDSYRQWLDALRSSRRRDPKLQKQPESFFANMEYQEDAELNAALQDALVTSLFQSWKFSMVNHEDAGRQRLIQTSFNACSMALYRRGAYLNAYNLERLKSSLRANMLIPFSDEAATQKNYCDDYTFIASYSRLVAPFEKESDREPAMQCLSEIMLELPWNPLLRTNRSQAGTACGWIEQQRQHHGGELKNNAHEFGNADVVIACPDGSRFVAHASVLSQKSQKLAAAINFACISKIPKEEEDVLSKKNEGEIELSLDIPAKKVRWMLEHMYHGSIVVAKHQHRHARECCDDLLDLLLIADEFLCVSLLQECEMRLLSSDYRSCFCWFCNPIDHQENYSHLSNKVEGDNQHSITCFYCVHGPSELIGPDVALDVLAIGQNVGIPCYEDYFLQVLNFDSAYSAPGTKRSALKNSFSGKPLEALRNVAVGALLKNMAKVFENQTFLVSLKRVITGSEHEGELTRSEKNRSLHMLLEILLEELYSLTASAARMPVTSQPVEVNERRKNLKC